MSRKKKCSRTSIESPDCQDILPRTTLSSANRDHEKGKCHATKGSLLERPKGKPKRSGLAVGAWWRSNSKKGCHLCIKYAQLTSQPHLCGRDTQTITTAHRTSEGVADGMCTQVWAWMTNKCKTRMDQREIYKVRDLPYRGWWGWFLLLRKEGAQIPPSRSQQIRPDRDSYPRTRSSFPHIVSPSTSVFLASTRSSPTLALTVVSSKPSPWTNSLQIHCNGSVGLRSHPFEGAQSENRDLTIGAVCGKLLVQW